MAKAALAPYPPRMAARELRDLTDVALKDLVQQLCDRLDGVVAPSARDQADLQLAREELVERLRRRHRGDDDPPPDDGYEC